MCRGPFWFGFGARCPTPSTLRAKLALAALLSVANDGDTRSFLSVCGSTETNLGISASKICHKRRRIPPIRRVKWRREYGRKDSPLRCIAESNTRTFAIFPYGGCDNFQLAWYRFRAVFSVNHPKVFARILLFSGSEQAQGLSYKAVRYSIR